MKRVLLSLSYQQVATAVTVAAVVVFTLRATSAPAWFSFSSPLNDAIALGVAMISLIGLPPLRADRLLIAPS